MKRKRTRRSGVAAIPPAKLRRYVKTARMACIVNSMALLRERGAAHWKQISVAEAHRLLNFGPGATVPSGCGCWVINRSTK